MTVGTKHIAQASTQVFFRKLRNPGQRTNLFEACRASICTMRLINVGHMTENIEIQWYGSQAQSGKGSLHYKYQDKSFAGSIEPV